jgi:hypothetical protein
MASIYTLICSWCKHVTQVQASNQTHAMHQAGNCPACAAKGRSWSTWHIK